MLLLSQLLPDLIFGRPNFKNFYSSKKETIIISARHKQYTVAKSSVTCDHQTGLTKNAWVGMARDY